MGLNFPEAGENEETQGSGAEEKKRRQSRNPRPRRRFRRGETLLSIITDMGPGFLVTMGFIDPGNIAANVVAGATYGYQMLWVVVLGTILLILLQEMAARLGIASRQCLSEATRCLVGVPASRFLGLVSGMAAVSTVLAELMGAAVGLNLLFGLPLAVGGLITALAAGFVVWREEYHHVEDMIVGLVGVIGLSYLVEVFLARPEWGQVLYYSVVPHLTAQNALVTIGVLGAIVMPSNLYLHSAIVQNKDWRGDKLHHEFVDTTVSMVVGGLINAAIIIVAAAVFYKHGVPIQGIEEADRTLEPLAGPLAHYLFAGGLVLAGFASAITGSMAGSYAVGGFLTGSVHHAQPLFRKGFVGILAVASLFLFTSANPLTVMVLSQAFLGVLLPFSAIPLLIIMRRRDLVGDYANGPVFHGLGWAATILIIGINIFMLVTTIG